jgi:hypothetical protein
VFGDIRVCSYLVCVSPCSSRAKYNNATTRDQCFSPIAARMAAVWLASYPDGCYRYGSKKLEHVGRSVCYLPSLPWFLQRLDHYSGSGTSEKVVQKTGITYPPHQVVHVRCLVKVSQDGCVFENGPLVQWSDEANMLKMYYLNPKDAYTARVVQVQKCVQAQKIHLRWSRVGRLLTHGPINVADSLIKAVWGDSANHVQVSCSRTQWDWHGSRIPFSSFVGQDDEDVDFAPDVEGGDVEFVAPAVRAVHPTAEQILAQWGIEGLMFASVM